MKQMFLPNVIKLKSRYCIGTYIIRLKYYYRIREILSNIRKHS